IMQTIEERYLAAKRALFDKVYSSLNERQRDAVFTVNHPLLVLAGAGSGKTTVLVRRIAFIIRYGNAYYSDYVPYGVTEARVRELEGAMSLSASDIEFGILPEFTNNACEPYRILAITFTNKAANEIKERLAKMFPDDPATASDIWTGTFHSVCVRILRQHCEKMGYRQGFTIYDTDDSKKMMIAAMQRCGIDEKLLPVKAVMNTVSRAKDRLMSPDDFAMEAGQDYRKKQIARVFEAYQQLLRESNALDFDDIIVQTVRLLEKYPDVRESYQKRFKYVCVDEFQDTNVAQLQLTVMLSGFYQNLMVVGDDDQSIYRFRGATIENILTFDKTFPEAKVIKLEQNYRSTQTILDAANAVISNNAGRKGKTLWTAAGEGEKIHLRQCDDQNLEARFIVDTVNRTVAKGLASYRDFAVLYRTNAQSQSIEKAFARSAVPYRVLGGTRFTDRKEIRDAVAYLQLVNNHDDNVRLNRIINEPRRKIGAKTLDTISLIAEEQGCSHFSVIERAASFTALERSRATLEQFAALINSLSELSKTVTLDVLFDAILDRSGYRQMLIDAGPAEAERLENLDEFKSGILEYMEENDEPTLTGFLEETALVADVDRYDESADAVVMMTIHSAKGLEFPIVFLPGMEDGLFPGMQTITAGESEMEEERRLAYVAITRAKKELYIIHTKNRLLYGQTMYNPVSRFVSEIPSTLVEKPDDDNTFTGFGSGFGSRASGGFGGGYGGFGSRPSGNVYGSRGAEAPAAQKRTYYSERPAPVSVPRPAAKPVAERATVGKPLQTPRPASKEIFSAGDRVRHMTFGDGEIISVRPMGADTLYEIVFDRVGTKKLMATYAKLKKI
ncbi:MAG: UvrD-helicase domain-containing protein, partial [Clostridia bacterium]|nr:UvrD-helicase domain-containing protein [Clostridia bacterium]